jgi:site-specific DNA-methyltransferase (adenine-specific)
MRKLIIENTKEGDIIFDPFMGSGSTAEAAKMENRNFIGCEINKTYFDIASSRVKKHEQSPTLFKY